MVLTSVQTPATRMSAQMQVTTKRINQMRCPAQAFQKTSSVMGSMIARTGLTKDLIWAIAQKSARKMLITMFAPMEVVACTKSCCVTANAIVAMEKMKALNIVTVDIQRCSSAVKEDALKGDSYALH